MFLIKKTDSSSHKYKQISFHLCESLERYLKDMHDLKKFFNVEGAPANGTSKLLCYEPMLPELKKNSS